MSRDAIVAQEWWMPTGLSFSVRSFLLLLLIRKMDAKNDHLNAMFSSTLVVYATQSDERAPGVAALRQPLAGGQVDRFSAALLLPSNHAVFQM